MDDLGVSSLTDLKIVDAEAETAKDRKGHAAKRSLFGDSEDEEDSASRNGNSKTESINSLESTGKSPIDLPFGGFFSTELNYNLPQLVLTWEIHIYPHERKSEAKNSFSKSVFSALYCVINHMQRN